MTGASFDGDALLASLKLPTITLKGRTYTGRLLSMPEFLTFRERLTGPAAGVAGDTIVEARRFAALVRDLTVAIYGRGRPWWAVWRPTVAAHLLAMPAAVQVEALKSFLQSQMERFEADAERLQPRTGTASETKTP